MTTISFNDFGSDEAKWAAVLARDAAADDAFIYAVRTTGIYCRPTCPSRRPSRENAEFYAGSVAAEQAGYRPCYRCRPQDPPLSQRHALSIAKACRLIEASEDLPSLDELAQVARLSRFHFHRVFTSVVGLTPKGYAAACRQDRVRQALMQRDTITDAIYESGFNSSGGFYASANRMLGMTPKRYRKRGKGMKIHFILRQCSLGTILVATSEKGICSIALGNHPEPLLAGFLKQFENAILLPGGKRFDVWVAKAVAFVEDADIGLLLPPDIRGIAFQQRVWQALTQAQGNLDEVGRTDWLG